MCCFPSARSFCSKGSSRFATTSSTTTTVDHGSLPYGSGCATAMTATRTVVMFSRLVLLKMTISIPMRQRILQLPSRCKYMIYENIRYDSDNNHALSRVARRMRLRCQTCFMKMATETIAITTPRQPQPFPLQPPDHCTTTTIIIIATRRDPLRRQR